MLSLQIRLNPVGSSSRSAKHILHISPHVLKYPGNPLIPTILKKKGASTVYFKYVLVQVPFFWVRGCRNSHQTQGSACLGTHMVPKQSSFSGLHCSVVSNVTFVIRIFSFALNGDGIWPLGNEVMYKHLCFSCNQFEEIIHIYIYIYNCKH